MMSKYNKTYHAVLRFSERFPDLNFDTELADTIPYGVQRGTDQLLLSRNNVVFAIKEGVIVTVLTKQQAIGNMSLTIGITDNIDLEPTQVSIAKKKKKMIIAKENIGTTKRMYMKQYIKRIYQSYLSNENNFTFYFNQLKEELIILGYPAGKGTLTLFRKLLLENVTV